jgi:membrane protein implicated in regulation of membrane protease activity
VFLIVGIVLLFAVPWPWGLVAFLACLVGFAGEVMFWYRKVRGTGIQAGAETLIGRTATVASPCRPYGQVQLAGESELWSARCAEGAERGASVRVVAVDDITLIVERADAEPKEE